MTKRWLSLGVVLAIFVSLFNFLPTSADTQDFTIKSFDADYYLSRDPGKISQATVREQIVAEFPNFNQNHGILRAIPQEYNGHSVELEVQSVANKSGQAIPHSTYTENKNLVLQIGESSKFVHGEQNYVIEYKMRSVTQNFAEQSEFYWDINGDQWQQPFGQVTARVHVPQEIAASLQDRQLCFTGSQGSTMQNCTTSRSQQNGGVVVEFKAQNLEPRQTLTVVMAFDANTFAVHSPSSNEILGLVLFASFIGVPPLIALVTMIIIWRRGGRGAKVKDTVVPQYLPPDQTSVIASSVVLRESFWPVSVSATIIDLAVRHYIKIYETTEKKFLSKTTNYKLELIKAPTNLKPEELKVIEMIFGKKAEVGKKVSLKSAKSKLYKRAKAIGNEVIEQLVEEKFFTRTPNNHRMPFILMGIVLMTVGIFSMILLHLGLVGTAIAGLIVLLGALAMSPRTNKAAELKNYLLGLKEYMKMAEAERLKILQSPKGRLTEKIDVNDTDSLVKLYERLLPYAMILGIEKDWAKQFAHLYQKPPEWYSGDSSFNAAYFATSMHSFTQQSSASFTSPASSSGSGFSGGGAAGGGGGGGGGGGW